MSSLSSLARPTAGPAASFIGEGVRFREANLCEGGDRLVARLDLVQATEPKLSDKSYRVY